ncbi:hypothetical protein [Rufibacter psychrotolerans]|uniref:hypothetical protein n=1 Tax=Rufibacter psychrotolerans TaxID=2812556 RepID=UPI0019671D44|nr:hypothetical protein [Rufibacter sp. SYSU D00308]
MQNIRDYQQNFRYQPQKAFAKRTHSSLSLERLACGPWIAIAKSGLRAWAARAVREGKTGPCGRERLPEKTQQHNSYSLRQTEKPGHQPQKIPFSGSFPKICPKSTLLQGITPPSIQVCE